MNRWTDIIPPGPIYADPLNELAREVAKLLRMSVSGAELEQAAGGLLLTVPTAPARIFARVYLDGDSEAGSGSGAECDRTAYRWQQQRPSACGEWEDDPVGMSGSVASHRPAYQLTDEGVSEGSLVELIPGRVRLGNDGRIIQEFLFLQTAGSTSDTGFWAVLLAGPDSNDAVYGGGACGSNDPDGTDCLPLGYAWAQVTGSCCDGTWVPIQSSGGGLLNYGTICHRQAYEANGQDTPTTLQNGRATVVWMRRRPTTPQSPPCDPSQTKETFVFERPIDLPPPCGSGCCGTPITSLVTCDSINAGCLAVEIEPGVFVPVVLLDDAGNKIVG